MKDSNLTESYQRGNTLLLLCVQMFVEIMKSPSTTIPEELKGIFCLSDCKKKPIWSSQQKGLHDFVPLNPSKI